MSFVSGVVLITEPMDDEEGNPEAWAAIKGWLAEKAKGTLSGDLAGFATGGKHPQLNLYCAGFNYFEEDEFAGVVMAQLWFFPENVILLIKPEEGLIRIWRGDKASPVKEL